MRCSEIRRRFVEYYQNLGFQLLPRAPMMHPSIPMSFVMSAGLVQVETSLASIKERSGNKFVLVQDCFRHFDLNSIGTDNTHLSLFEMPAAFIFGENARKTAISHIWHVATEMLGIDSERLWVTYFSGDEISGHSVPEDHHTHQVWREVGVSEQRLVGLDQKHNYWIQGGGIQNGGTPLRKCGANTELFYDMGEESACGPDCQPGCRCGRFVEFSNTLFVSHHLNSRTNTLTPMDDPFTESVIGTERVEMIQQSVSSVFETDRYRPIIETIHQFVARTDLPSDTLRESEWTIADHLRAIYTLINDGAPPPGKNGRERIMKLLIRKMITRQILLGISEQDFFSKLLIESSTFFQNGNGSRSMKTIETMLSYVETESQRFQKTMQEGQKILERMLKTNQGRPLSGKQMVILEKSWGLPYPLISMTLRKKNLQVLEKEYYTALTIWKQSLSNTVN